MGIAGGALDFDSLHPQTVVLDEVQAVSIGGSKEAGPTAARIKLGVRAEEELVAANAMVVTGSLFVPVHAGEGSFRARLTGDMKLLGRELSTPFFIAFFDSVAHERNPARSHHG